jgi:hypothetical protein
VFFGLKVLLRVEEEVFGVVLNFFHYCNDCPFNLLSYWTSFLSCLWVHPLSFAVELGCSFNDSTMYMKVYHTLSFPFFLSAIHLVSLSSSSLLPLTLPSITRLADLTPTYLPTAYRFSDVLLLPFTFHCSPPFQLSVTRVFLPSSSLLVLAQLAYVFGSRASTR